MKRKLTDKQLNMLISRVIVQWYKKRYRKTAKSMTMSDIKKMRQLRQYTFKAVKQAQRQNVTLSRRGY